MKFHFKTKKYSHFGISKEESQINLTSEKDCTGVCTSSDDKYTSYLVRTRKKTVTVLVPKTDKLYQLQTNVKLFPNLP